MNGQYFGSEYHAISVKPILCRNLFNIPYSGFRKAYTRYETNGKVVFSKNIDSMVGENVYVYTKEPEKYIDCFIENIAHFEYQEETYYLLYIKSEGLKKHNSNIIGG